MAQAQVKTTEKKPAARKVCASQVRAVQARVAALVGSGELSAAPVSYHH